MALGGTGLLARSASRADVLAAGQGLLPQLAKSAGVTARTIKRFEALDKVPPSHSSTLLDVKAALEAAGIEFIGSPTDWPGIRMAAHHLKPGRETAPND